MGLLPPSPSRVSSNWFDHIQALSSPSTIRVSTALMSKDDPICWFSSSKLMISGAAEIVVALLQGAAAAFVTN
jgi:hypothetical protein